MLKLKMMRGLLLGLVCAGAAVYGYGQSSVDGAIGGVVQDATGSAIPGATVIVHSNTTDAEQTIAADASGLYRAIHLQPSTYTVTVTANGFGTFKSTGVTVEVGLLTDLSPKLSVDSAKKTAHVSAEASAI